MDIQWRSTYSYQNLRHRLPSVVENYRPDLRLSQQLKHWGLRDERAEFLEKALNDEALTCEEHEDLIEQVVARINHKYPEIFQEW